MQYNVMHVIFDKAKHTYYNNITNDIYISATQILSKFKKPFDRLGISAAIAKREKVTQQEILDRWDKIKDDACIKGTSIHDLLEQYIKLGLKDEQFSWIYSELDETIERIVEGKHDYMHSEKLLYNDEFKIAGTCDLLIDCGDEFCVFDFKTNKKIATSNKYKDFLLYPLDFIQNCEYNVYALQLSLYAFMYEKLTGKRVKNLCIFFIQDNKMIPYNVPYLKLEIRAMLNHYVKNNPSSK
jgi:ATP-dependent exoDNAse (exonuclease V) beta subunit